MEELGSFGWVGRCECFHLSKDVEELCRGQGIEGSGDSIGAIHSRWEILPNWQRWEG